VRRARGAFWNIHNAIPRGLGEFAFVLGSSKIELMTSGPKTGRPRPRKKTVEVEVCGSDPHFEAPITRLTVDEEEDYRKARIVISWIVKALPSRGWSLDSKTSEYGNVPQFFSSCRPFCQGFGIEKRNEVGSPSSSGLVR